METCSEASTPRSEAGDYSEPSLRPSPTQHTPTRGAADGGAKAIPSWLTEWRLKLALSSKVHAVLLRWSS